jgi:asparagine synthase (glutamine-hydrolysing)
MCGIAGYMEFNGQPVDTDLIHRMCNKMVHRGPDDEGVFIRGSFAMGMRRLSIIDLKGGHQPISNEDETIHIVFNGEIYNYIELREELLSKGHRFRTDSDTEVILHLYEDYRTESLKHLNGMFAFAIWDDNKKELFCARDRIGIKPFYYYMDGKRIIFASELKALLEADGVEKDLDIVSLYQFLTFEFIPFPGTLIRKIRKLPPGSFMVANNGETVIKQYWNAAAIQENELSEPEAIDELYSLLKDSVKLRLRSDVPFGAFLSGGIDSSTITGIMAELLDNKVKTFSIGFEDDSYNELDFARRIAVEFGTDHTEQIIQPSAVALIDELIEYMDDPIGDFSIFPTFLVSKMTREKVKVAISGDGGDELFGGYDTYVAQMMYRFYTMIPGYLRRQLIEPLMHLIPPRERKKGVINKAKRFIEGACINERYNHFRWMMFLNPQDSNALFVSDIADMIDMESIMNFIPGYLDENSLSGLNRSMYLDIKTYLVDNILVKVDRMSMACSLEVRVPFLDHRLVEFALSMPDSLKLRNLRTKYILKKMSAKLLPEEIIKKPKQGFSIPMKNWLKGPLKERMLDLLSVYNIKNQGIFNKERISSMITEHLSNQKNNSHQLWSLMLFQLWMKRFISA